VNSVFLDTSGLVGVVNTDDQWHGQAEKIWTELISSSNELITTSLVLIELADGLARIKHRELALQIVDGLRASDRVMIVALDESLEATA